jgi:hypothetical protein
MVDNPSESRVGWSFLDDERNKFDVDGEWWLHERIFQEQGLRKQFINENPDSSSRPMRNGRSGKISFGRACNFCLKRA